MQHNHRRALCLLLAAALLLLAGAELPLRTARAEDVIAAATVNTGRLNVRSKPNAKSAIITTVARGDSVNIRSVESNGWFRIDVPSSGKIGYVSGGYLLVDSTAAAYGVGLTKARVNLRSSASTSSASSGVIASGKGLLVLSASGSWYQVYLIGSGQTGYMYQKYVRIVCRAGKATPSGDKAQAYINASNVHLRSGAGTTHPSLGHLARNTALEVLAVSGQWTQVRVVKTGKTGYVFSVYVTVSGATPSPSPTATPTLLNVAGTMTGNNVNFRKGPSVRDASLGKLKRGTALTVLAKAGDWYQVRVNATGTTGYVFGSFVALSTTPGAPTPTPTATPSGTAAQLTGDRVNLRKGPSAQYTSLGKLSRGTALTILGQTGDWYQVRVNATGKTGYIYKAYVSIPKAAATPTATQKVTAAPTATPTAAPSATPKVTTAPTPTATPSASPTASPAA